MKTIFIGLGISACLTMGCASAPVPQGPVYNYNYSDAGAGGLAVAAGAAALARNGAFNNLSLPRFASNYSQPSTQRQQDWGRHSRVQPREHDRDHGRSCDTRDHDRGNQGGGNNQTVIVRIPKSATELEPRTPPRLPTQAQPAKPVKAKPGKPVKVGHPGTQVQAHAHGRNSRDEG